MVMRIYYSFILILSILCFVGTVVLHIFSLIHSNTEVLEENIPLLLIIGFPMFLIVLVLIPRLAPIKSKHTGMSKQGTLTETIMHTIAVLYVIANFAVHGYLLSAMFERDKYNSINGILGDRTRLAVETQTKHKSEYILVTVTSAYLFWGLASIAREKVRESKSRNNI
jgi:hypothetical protein